jgi:hypothetical protein
MPTTARRRDAIESGLSTALPAVVEIRRKGELGRGEWDSPFLTHVPPTLRMINRSPRELRRVLEAKSA